MFHQIIDLKETDSTNNYLEELLEKQDLAEGTVVISEYQRKGKGMLQNPWHSEKGKNLLFSILLKPIQLHVDQQFFLSKSISLAVHDMLTDIMDPEKIQIKWPNDILVDGKKICGILIKCSLRKSTVQYAILGIGLNINQSSFLEEISATSIVSETGIISEVDQKLKDLLKKIDARMGQFNSKHFEKINEDYNNRLLGYNQWLQYSQSGKVFDGKIKEVKNNGRLLLEKRDGSSVFFEVKEINLISTQQV